jgi:hypothetical protein
VRQRAIECRRRQGSPGGASACARPACAQCRPPLTRGSRPGGRRDGPATGPRPAGPGPPAGPPAVGTAAAHPCPSVLGPCRWSTLRLAPGSPVCATVANARRRGCSRRRNALSDPLSASGVPPLRARRRVTKPIALERQPLESVDRADSGRARACARGVYTDSLIIVAPCGKHATGECKQRC